MNLVSLYLDIYNNLLFVYMGQAYNLEKQSEPGISIPGYIYNNGLFYLHRPSL